MTKANIEEFVTDIDEAIEKLNALKEIMQNVDYAPSKTTTEDIAYDIDDGDLDDWSLSVSNIGSAVTCIANKIAGYNM